MTNALTTPDYWRDEHWQLDSSHAAPDVVFDPEGPEFRELNRLIRRHLSGVQGRRCLEIGCHPGRYLWYFHTQLGYDVSGIEYVEPACDLTRAALQRAGVPAQIFHADLFDFRPPDGKPYDVVLSVGLVEHFVDIRPVVERHIELLAPGGTLVIIAPNHRGLPGMLLRRILPDVYARHNQMRFADLSQAIAAHPEMSLLEGGYVGRFNLAPTNFCPWAQGRFRPAVYTWIERWHRWMLKLAPWLPNSRFWSPYIAAVARRKSCIG